MSGEIRLDKSRTGVDVDLTQGRLAGVDESMRCVRRNDDQPSPSTFAELRRQAATAWQASDNVGREGRALSVADELVRHSNKRQLLETDEAHGGKLRESLQSSRVKFEENEQV